MQLVVNRPGREMKYLTNLGMEIKFARSRYFVTDSQTNLKDQDRVEFWNSSAESSGVDFLIQFVADPEDRIAGVVDGVRKNHPPGTDLHRAFLGVLTAGDPPEPFLDLLVETYPDLGGAVDLYLTKKGK